MDVNLTDLLVCPRCGPPYALILLAERVSQRRVLAGTLGCANCYRRYAVREGVADLRPEATSSPPGTAAAQAPAAVEATSPGPAAGAEEAPSLAETPSSGAPGARADRAFRVAALMGLSDALGAGRAIALLAGPVAAEAPAVAGAAEGYEIVAAGGEGVVDQLPEASGVSRILVAGRLPFFDGALRGVALSGAAADGLLEEGVRVLNPMGRLVVEEAPPGAAERIAAAGGRVLASEGRTVVAVTLRAFSAGP